MRVSEREGGDELMTKKGVIRGGAVSSVSLRSRAWLYKLAFDSFHQSALRGGGGAGVLFWILYHKSYESLNSFGGGYGEAVCSWGPGDLVFLFLGIIINTLVNY